MITTRDEDRAEMRRRWALVAVLCAVMGGLNAFAWYVRMQDHKAAGWGHAVGIQGTHWLLWAASYPLFHALARRFTFEPGRALGNAAACLLLALPVVLVHGVLYVTVAGGLMVAASIAEPNPLASPAAFVMALMTLDMTYRLMGYACLLTAAWALEFRARSQRDARRAAQLEAQLATARLEALKMQLNPHFLFNTLNSVSALLHRDPEGADRMIARLGSFLRLTLDAAGSNEVPLRDELRFARTYLEIEEVRFRDRLATRFDVAEDTELALVPNLVLQPLVENAIRHGIGQLTGRGEIGITARRAGDRLQLEVCDNGPGRNGNGHGGGGLGLGNTAARLAALYGADHALHAGDRPGGGWSVRLEIPFRCAS